MVPLEQTSKFRTVFRSLDGRLVATLAGLAVVALINIVIAYQRNSVADSAAAVVIFLVIGPWFAVRWFRRSAAIRPRATEALSTAAPETTRIPFRYDRGVTALGVLLGLLLVAKIAQAIRHQAGSTAVLQSFFALLVLLAFLRCHVQFGKDLVALALEPSAIERISFSESVVTAACLLLALMLLNL
jgi:hypothetical protein